MNEAFAAWLRQIDRELEKASGCSHPDLPNELWLDWFLGGFTPEYAAKECLKVKATKQ